MTASSGQPTCGQAHLRPDEDAVNNVLTPKRRGPVTENSEYAAFARRILRAYSRRIATGDVESLAHLIGLADDVNDSIQEAVNGLRKAGYSWAEIGTRLGISRQAAQQRWGSATLIPGFGVRRYRLLISMFEETAIIRLFARHCPDGIVIESALSKFGVH